MGNMKTKLVRVEASLGGAQGLLAGVLRVPRGTRPLDMLKSAAPGLWLMLCEGLDHGLMGRVSSSGKCQIIFGGRHAQH